jgi:hypothetical protein
VIALYLGLGLGVFALLQGLVILVARSETK